MCVFFLGPIRSAKLVELIASAKIALASSLVRIRRAVLVCIFALGMTFVYFFCEC